VVSTNNCVTHENKSKLIMCMFIQYFYPIFQYFLQLFSISGVLSVCLGVCSVTRRCAFNIFHKLEYVNSFLPITNFATWRYQYITSCTACYRCFTCTHCSCLPIHLTRMFPTVTVDVAYMYVLLYQFHICGPLEMLGTD